MLHYTFETQKSPKDLGCKNVIESIEKIVKAPYYEEIIDLLNYNFSKIDIVNSHLIKFSNCPLELYSAYSNAQILAGFGEYTESRYFPLTSGVWYIENEKTDIFFVTLNKSEKHYALKLNMKIILLTINYSIGSHKIKLILIRRRDSVT